MISLFIYNMIELVIVLTNKNIKLVNSTLHNIILYKIGNGGKFETRKMNVWKKVICETYLLFADIYDHFITL